eukprot:COSAG01_NODE_530_length_15875_cov_27.779982_3_plen_202_part_00
MVVAADDSHGAQLTTATISNNHHMKQYFVKSISGRTRPFWSIDSQDGIMEELQAQTGWDCSSAFLMFGGKPIRDSMTPQEVGMQPGSTLALHPYRVLSGGDNDDFYEDCPAWMCICLPCMCCLEDDCCDDCCNCDCDCCDDCCDDCCNCNCDCCNDCCNCDCDDCCNCNCECCNGDWECCSGWTCNCFEGANVRVKISPSG